MKAIIWTILGIIVFVVTLIPVMFFGAMVAAFGTASRIYGNVREEIAVDRIVNRINDQEISDLRSLH